MIAKDGLTRWFNLSATAIKDEADNFISSRSGLFDVSERKQAEAALSQSEEKFRQLAENIQDVFWMMDIANRQVLYVSPSYETVWGRSRESLYQNFREWLEAVHPDDLLGVEQAFREQAVQGCFNHEYRLVHPDGSIRWVRDRAFPIRNAAGEVIRTAGIAEDITERQRVEEIKNEFISVVSHELRTPLTAIQMSLGLLKTGIYANKPEKFQRMLDIAYVDTNRLVNLVNDILDLERLESGRAILEKTACRAGELMQQTNADLILNIQLPEIDQIVLDVQVTQEIVLIRGQWRETAGVEGFFHPSGFESLIPLPYPVHPRTALAETQPQGLLIQLSKQVKSQQPIVRFELSTSNSMVSQQHA